MLCAQEETTLVMIFDVMMIAIRALMAFYCHVLVTKCLPLSFATELLRKSQGVCHICMQDVICRALCRSDYLSN